MNCSDVGSKKQLLTIFRICANSLKRSAIFSARYGNYGFGSFPANCTGDNKREQQLNSDITYYSSAGCREIDEK
jgi:hypothetical protein